MRTSTRSITTTTAEPEIKLPLAEAIEKSVLGLFFINSEAIGRAIEHGLKPDHFFVPSNKTIYGAMLDAHLNGTEVHPVTISDKLKTHHKLETVGGMAYVAELIDGSAPGITMLGSLVDQLKTVAFKRQTLKNADRLMKMASNGASPTDIQEVIDAFESANVTPSAYAMTPTGLIYRKPGRGFGFDPERLANFNARIVAEQIEDDGSLEEQRIFEIEADLDGRQQSIRVPASKFAAMAWPTAMIGARAIVYPSQADKARAAIQSLSHNIRQMTVFTHTGWRQIDGVWSYLHSGGAITPTGNRTDVSVRLPDSLRLFFLPEPPDEENYKAAFNPIIEFKDAFPKHITIPLIGSVLGSVLGGVNYSAFLTGTSGTFKSELTALAQSFFGAMFDSQHFPANWNDTGNVLLAKMFTAKDCWLVIDDFVPIGQKSYDDRLHAKAEVVFRAAANRSARGRANVDGSERSAKEPRGTVGASGEDIPKGGSLQNRLLILALIKGDVDKKQLTLMQKMSREGKFALSMSAFLHYVASDYTNLIAAFNKDRLELRQRIIDRAESGGHTHTRQPTTLAHLAASWRVWLNACVAREALTKDDAAKLWREVWKTLVKTIEDQKAQQSSLHPAEYFCNLIRSALLSGRCHLATVEGTMPETANRYGWRDGVAQGECAGWIKDGLIYLQPEAAYKNANLQGFSIGEGLPVGQKKLYERMDERGLIVLKDKGRGLQSRVPVIRAPAVVIAVNSIFDDSDDFPAAL
jgi:hypothetical protein